MNTIISIKSKCPHCGKEQNHHLNHYTSGDGKIDTGLQMPQVVLCYPEEGGCDSYYAIQYKLTPQVETFKIFATDAAKDNR